MGKQDNTTGEPVEQKRGRGRPALANAKTGAERQAEYLKRRKEEVEALKRHVTEKKQTRPVGFEYIEKIDTATRRIGHLEADIVLLNSTLLTRSNELDAAREEIQALRRQASGYVCRILDLNGEIKALKAKKRKNV